jgi:hypothetical protein
MPKLGTIQHVNSVCRALAEGGYTHRHSEVANIVINRMSNMECQRDHHAVL